MKCPNPDCYDGKIYYNNHLRDRWFPCPTCNGTDEVSDQPNGEVYATQTYKCLCGLEFISLHERYLHICECPQMKFSLPCGHRPADLAPGTSYCLECAEEADHPKDGMPEKTRAKLNQWPDTYTLHRTFMGMPQGSKDYINPDLAVEREYHDMTLAGKDALIRTLEQGLMLEKDKQKVEREKVRELVRLADKRIEAYDNMVCDFHNRELSRAYMKVSLDYADAVKALFPEGLGGEE